MVLRMTNLKLGERYARGQGVICASALNFVTKDSCSISIARIFVLPASLLTLHSGNVLV